MSIPTTSPPASIYGRRVTEQARRLNKHPNFFYRLFKRGLKATLVGGTWYVRDEDLDEFFAAKTAARLGAAAPSVHRTDSSKPHEAADRALAEAGW